MAGETTRRSAKKKSAARPSPQKGNVSATSDGGRGQTSRLDLETVHQVLDLMATHHLSEFEITDRDLHIRLCKRGGNEIAPSAPDPDQAPMVRAPAPHAPPPPAASDPGPHEGTVPIKSPMVGTIYRSPAPDVDSFVSLGDHITEDTVICIIEAMKVMNEIKAEVEGEVVTFLVENGEPIEFGQPIMLVRPTSDSGS